jgi:hypothetical protein
MIFVVPILTLVYLPFLVAVNALDRETRQQRPLATSLFVTNAAFLLIVLCYWIVSIKLASATSCADGQCAWIEGRITAKGAGDIVIFSVMQVIANTAPTLMLYPRRTIFWDDPDKERR